MRVLLALVGGFGTGVFLRSLFVFGLPVLLFIAGIALIGAAAFRITKRPLYVAGFLFCTTFIAGALRLETASLLPPPELTARIGTSVTYEGVVVIDPDIRDTHQRITIALSGVRMLAIAERYPRVEAGARIKVTGTLALPEAFASDAEDGRIFRYDKFLEKDGVRFLISNARIERIDPAPWYSLSSKLAEIKNFFLTGLRKSLPEPHASLAGGLVLGGKSGLGNDLKDAFIVSGLIPIIVLSGYNVMIVAEWVMYAIGYFKFRRKFAALAGAGAVILFVLIAGAESSAVRAGLMALIALYARASGRTYAAGRALLVVAFLMVLTNPLLLVFDPGFDLSVIATAGLIFLTPLIEPRLLYIKSVFWRSLLATTLAAQIAVLPLLLYQTGNLSLVAVPANLLVLPIVPLTMAGAALAGFFGNFLGPLSLLVGYPTYVLTSYIIFIAERANELPFAALHIPAFPFWPVLGAYTALIYFTASKRFSTTPQFKLLKKASM